MTGDCRDSCPIANGGFCERHAVEKRAHWVELCRREKDDYWRAWEAGRGPGQRRMPSLFRQAWNVAQAILAFVDNPGFVDAETYRRRLEVCEQCLPPEGYRINRKCSHCGCIIAVKAAGKAWACPAGKFPALEKASPCGCHGPR